MFGRRRTAQPIPAAGATGPADGPTDRSVDPFGDLLGRRLDRIERDLHAASGGASLCAISRSAGSVPGVKYLEGRMAVIAELRRAVRAGQPFVDVLVDRTSVWRAELVLTDVRSMSPDWRAYRAGGVDELESLRVVAAGLPD